MKKGQRRLLLLLCLFTLSGTVCEDINKAVTLLEDAKKQVLQESGQWQVVLDRLKGDLVTQGLPQVAKEVDGIIRRGEAQAGVELRCNVDFVAGRVAAAIDRLIQRLRGLPVSPVEPGRCQVDPLAISVEELMANRLTQLTYFGWDFFTDSANDTRITAVIGLADGSTRPLPTNAISMPTHYQMTIRLVGPDIRIDDDAKQLILRWNGKDLGTVGIIPRPPLQAATVCSEPFTTPDLHNIACDSGDCASRCSRFGKACTGHDKWCYCSWSQVLNSTAPTRTLVSPHFVWTGGEVEWNELDRPNRWSFTASANNRTVAGAIRVGSRGVSGKLCATEEWR